MPEKRERELRKTAKKLYPFDKERQDRLVYGTLYNEGWRPKASQRKHAAKTHGASQSE